MAQAARNRGWPALILIDSSVWIRKWAGREPYVSGLDRLLERDDAVGHELVYGELLVGSNPGQHRDQFLTAIADLGWLPPAPHHQVVTMVSERHLAGRGLGWIDAHLLAAALNAQCPLWTADEVLARAAEEARIGWMP